MDLEERNRSMQSFFNEKANEYDAVHAKLMNTKDALTATIPTHAKKILDLGVGTGLELFDLFSRVPDARVTGIDISEGMLAHLAERSFADRVRVICGNFFTVDFGNGYDAVISSSALHHFTAKDKMLLYRKIFESLAPNGMFLNADCIANTLDEEAAALSNYEQNKDRESHIDTPLAKESEEQLIRAVGFADVSITDLENPRYKLLVAYKTNHS